MSEQLITIAPGIVVIVLMSVLNRHQVLLEYVPLVKAVLPPNMDITLVIGSAAVLRLHNKESVRSEMDFEHVLKISV